MAEKVRPGPGGFHFRTDNALALATLRRHLAADRSQLDALQASMRRPLSANKVVKAHVALYKQGSSVFLKKRGGFNFGSNQRGTAQYCSD